MIDPLIHGKSGLQKIVGIEPQNEQSELFIQNDDGTVTSQMVPNRYWVLSNQKLNSHAVRLKGDLYYKYGYQFTEKQNFYKFKRNHKQADLYSIGHSKESQMVKDGYVYYLGLDPKDVKVISFDLETTTLDPTLPDAKVLLISCTTRFKDTLEKHLFSYDDYESEQAMIGDFCAYVREKDASIVLGHNIMTFDIPYLLERNGGNLPLGRDGSNVEVSSFESHKRFDGTRDIPYHRVAIYGREIVDTLFLAINYDIGKKYESYALKKIIDQEGLVKENRTFYDASQIRFNYKDPVEWEKIKAYCVDDSDDALALFDLMVGPFWCLTQSVPKPFQLMIESATGSQLNSMMIRSYLQEFHSLPKASPAYPFEGAISLGIPGIYKNAIRWDVASLYPSIIRQYQIGLGEKDPKGNFLKIATYFTVERLRNKKLFKETGEKKYDDLQAAQKVGANSLYGFLGATGLLFNHPPAAEEITRQGREILLKGINWATGIQKEEIIRLCNTEYAS